MKNILKNEILENIKNVKAIKNEPIYGICSILSLTMVSTSFIAFIIAYVSFINNGGYNMKNTEVTFTVGNVENFIYSNIVLMIITLCLIIGSILTIILFFKNSKKSMRVLMIISLSLIVFSFILEFLFYYITNNNVYLPISILKLIYKNAKTIALMIFCTRFIPLIGIFFLIKSNSKCKIVKHIIIAGIISMGILPLVLLILENIISIFMVILGIVIFGGFIYIVSIGGRSNKKIITIRNEDGSFHSRFEVPWDE